MKFSFGLAAFLLAGVAQAQSTPPVLLTVLREPKGIENPQQAKVLVDGLVRCDAAAALPKDVFAPLGVKFRSSSLRADAAYPELVESLVDAPLVGNDVSAMERTAEGKFLNYGSSYRLQKGIVLSPGLQIKQVGVFTGITPPRLIVGVTFGFNKPAVTAIAELDAAYGTSIRSRIDAGVKPETAKTTDVWFTVDAAKRAVTCWRYPHKRIIE